MCCLEIVNICFLIFKWKIANIFARLWKSAQFCHWAIFPSSAANFRPADRWNRKSQIIPKLGRILKFKPQQCYKLIKTLLQTENQGKLGFELWPRFADFARFFCAFALKSISILSQDKRANMTLYPRFFSSWMVRGQIATHLKIRCLQTWQPAVRSASQFLYAKMVKCRRRRCRHLALHHYPQLPWWENLLHRHLWH